MEQEVLSNESFLQGWLATKVAGGILPNEIDLILNKLAFLEAEFQNLIDVKKATAEQSGDNWHDGAFRATDEAALNVTQRAGELRRLLKLPVVEYPEQAQTTASLGSLVRVRQGSVEFDVRICGTPSLYDEDDGIEFCSLESPLGQALIGRAAGDTGRLVLANETRELLILAVMQPPQPYV